MGRGREAKERSVGEQAAERSPQVLAVPLLLLLFRMFAESLRQPDSPAAPFGKAGETSVSQTDEA